MVGVDSAPYRVGVVSDRVVGRVVESATVALAERSSGALLNCLMKRVTSSPPSELLVVPTKVRTLVLD